MKKTLVLSILGITAAVTTSYGQGSIQFNSYVANNSAGIITTFGAGVSGQTQGSGLTSGWTAGLIYSLTPISDAATTSSATASAALNTGFTFAPNTAIFQSTAGGVAGFFQGANFTLASGAPDGTTIYFEVIAYQTGSTYDLSTIRGHSASFTGVMKATPNSPITMDNMAPFSVFTTSVAPVPEPSTLALAGLGGFGMLMAMRRKKA